MHGLLPPVPKLWSVQLDLQQLEPLDDPLEEELLEELIELPLLDEEDDELLNDVQEKGIFPIWFPTYSVNQIFPSGPVVMPFGLLEVVGRGYSVIIPVVVIFPILSV